MDNAQFNLRWNNHSFNIVQVFLEQLSSESLVDVTLSCQGQFIKAHKMVLSACSSYFQDLFNLHDAQHPVIILNGIKFHDLKMVVEFMYKGETKVLESELNGILAVAEALQVKGLSNVRSEDKFENNQSSISPDDCFPSVAMNENFGSDLHCDVPGVDSLEVSSALSDSSKPGRKRKRASEISKTGSLQDGSAKVQRSEDGLSQTNVFQSRPIASKPQTSRGSSSKVSSQKVSAPKASSPKTTPSKTNLHPKASSSNESLSRATSPVTTASQCSSEALSSRGISPIPSEFQSRTISSSEEPLSVSTGKASLSKPPAKVYPPKTPSKVNCKPLKSSSSSASSPHQLSQDEDEIPPFAQVTVNDLRNDDEEHDDDNDNDDDLATTIKVEPLFIRDIDDTDTSWDDPTRLVIDLPSEDSEGKKDDSNSPGNCEKSHMSVNKQGVRVKSKSKIKVRTESELVAADMGCGPPDPLEVELPKERLKGDRIPRPPNAFMIFANEWRKKLALENKTESNKQISVRLGIKWKALNAEKKEVYFCAARRADEEHKRKYPGYFYSPKEARIRKAMRHQSRFQTLNPSKNSEVSVQQVKNSKGPNHPIESLYIADACVVVKEEVLEEDSNQQNLEEEFLKMVEDGQVEAEAKVKDEKELNSEQANQQTSVEDQT